MTTRNVVTLLAAGLLGCASNEGTAPDDMSAAGHEQASGAEEAAAEHHGAQYDPDAAVSRTRCSKGVPCWTSTVNPTEQHRDDMQRHRELAEKHRAAGQALRDAETRSCVGLSDEDRDTSPFYHREDIVSVSEIDRPELQGKVQVSEVHGAKAILRAMPGITAEWLKRLVDCHMARAAAVGYAMEGMEYCPLALKGIAAAVTSTGDGFAVEVTSDDPKVAAEAWRRVKALTAR